MLRLTKENTQEHIIVTFTEKCLLNQPNYLLVFQHITTKEVIKVILDNDISAYPERFNEFVINPNDLFTTLGQYLYQAYEQLSDTNTDITGLNMVEQGRANVVSNAETQIKEYSTETTYKVYAG